jgi:hypothetical protein
VSNGLLRATNRAGYPPASGPRSATRRGLTRIFITGPVTTHAAGTLAAGSPAIWTRAQGPRPGGNQPTNSATSARQISAKMAPVSIHMIRSITESYRVTVWLRKGMRSSTGSVSEPNFDILIVPSGAARLSTTRGAHSPDFLAWPHSFLCSRMCPPFAWW